MKNENKKSELDVLFSISKELLCVFDIEGNLIKINGTWLKVLECSEDDLMGKKFLKFVPRDKLDEIFKLLQNVKEQAVVSDYHIEIMTKNGGVRWFEWKALLHGDKIYASAVDNTDKINTELNLKESEGRFKEFFENTPIGLLYYDNSGKIIECNDNFVKIIGSSKEKLKGLDMLSLPDTRVSSSIKKTLGGKSVKNLEIVYTSVTGAKTKPVRLIFSPVISDENNVTGGVGIIEDITERLAYEKKINKSKEMYKSLFEQAADGVVIGTKDGTLIDINKSMTILSGYNREELLGNNISCLFSRENLIEEPLDYKSVLAGQTVFKERELTKKDGSRLIVEVKSRELSDGRLQACFRDITERKLAEQAIRKNEDRLKRFFELNPYSIHIVDKNGRTISTNKAYLDLFGELPNKDYSVFNDKIMIKYGFQNEMLKSLKGETVFIPEFYYNSGDLGIGKSDRPMWLRMVMFPLQGLDNEIEMIVLMHENISEQHLLKERLKHTEKMEAIGQLTGGIAHDFNNMLSGIMGGAQLLERHIHTEKGKKYLNIINEAAQRTADLTNKLLTFSRKSNIEFKHENIIEAMKNAVEILRYTVDKKINISFEPVQENMFIYGDSSQLQNAFINLGINSCHAMPDGGDLTFRAQLKESGAFSREVGSSYYIKIAVEDTGVGISLENQQKIFEPFFTTRAVNEGSGLGLATVYGTVKDHDGYIRLNSEEGKGTTFYLYFPAVSPEDVVVDKTESSASLEKSSGCILLVDDEDMVIETNKIILEELGYKIYTAGNGREGVEIFSKKLEEIDLVILDMIMPEMNGLECFSELKKIDPGVRAIMSSGFSHESDIQKIKDKGVNTYLKKPFQIGDLVEAINITRKGDAGKK